MSRFCHACGIETENSAKFCGNCGAGLTGLHEKVVEEVRGFTGDAIDEKIRVKLKEFNQHRNLTCLECGYVGLMGISRVEEGKTKKRLIWLAAIFFLFSSIFTGGVGLIVSAGIGIYIGLDASKRDKTFVVCPSCLLELEVKK